MAAASRTGALQVWIKAPISERFRAYAKLREKPIDYLVTQILEATMDRDGFQMTDRADGALELREPEVTGVA